MNRIRTHAMQEAERRKFAIMFKAKTQPNTLDVNKNEKILPDENNPVLPCEKDIGKDRCCDKKLDDSGDIIPVTVVKDSEVEKVRRSTPVNSKEQNGSVVKNTSFLSNMPALSNMDLSKFCVVVDGSRCRYSI